MNLASSSCPGLGTRLPSGAAELTELHVESDADIYTLADFKTESDLYRLTDRNNEVDIC